MPARSANINWQGPSTEMQAGRSSTLGNINLEAMLSQVSDLPSSILLVILPFLVSVRHAP